jgi:MSHA biogenesis protein MshJ
MTSTFLERFNTLTAREKIIFFATLLVVVWSAWDAYLYQPILEKQNQLTSDLSSIKTQLLALQQATTQIEAIGKTDPNQANKQKLAKVKVELEKLKQQLDIGDKKFVPAALMAEVLRDMLKQNSGLKLVKLETLPVTTLSESSQQQSWVYRHGLSMTLSGNYFNTLNYLKSLESLPWRFNWDTVDYQVIEYPVAETTLNVYTLSFEENWLGL